MSTLIAVEGGNATEIYGVMKGAPEVVATFLAKVIETLVEGISCFLIAIF